MDILSNKTQIEIMDNMVKLEIMEKNWNDKENNYIYCLTEYGKKVDKIFEDEKSAKIQKHFFGDFC